MSNFGQLQEEAHQAALSEIKSLFQSSEQLEEKLSSCRIDFEKKKVCLASFSGLCMCFDLSGALFAQNHAEQQLSTLVHNQVEETRWTLEQLATQTQKMESIGALVRKIDDLCSSVRLPGSSVFSLVVSLD